MNVIWLSGLADYGETLEMQESIVAGKQENPESEDVLLLLQHRPVYTIGRTKDRSSLNNDAVLPFPIFEINRGGQATYHGPGQLVGYPIVDLNRMGKDLHLYIRGLEQTLIDTCAEYGVAAQVREGLVGIWVEDRKLASIGVGVRKWIAMHGFALNVTRESLTPFSSIIPCGIQGVRMTCLEDEIKLAGKEVPEDLLVGFGERFAVHWKSFCNQAQLTKD